jgi:transketolase
VINKLEPFKDKWDAFGWKTIEVDAHNLNELLSLWKSIENNPSGKPVAVIANSMKGKGVSFMENDPKWHHGGISDEIYSLAMKELV